jgi:hypothetical protein
VLLQLQSMGMHARSLPTADKDRSLASLRRHQQELQVLKKKLQQAEIAFTVRPFVLELNSLVSWYD